MNYLQLDCPAVANTNNVFPANYRIRAFDSGGGAVFPEYNGAVAQVEWPLTAGFGTYRVVAELLDSNGNRIGNELDVQVPYIDPAAPATVNPPVGAFIGPL
jgi:hypothetical protein